MDHAADALLGDAQDATSDAFDESDAVAAIDVDATSGVTGSDQVA
jgi:hypothetical protein